jgi:hypothetical protein
MLKNGPTVGWAIRDSYIGNASCSDASNDQQRRTNGNLRYHEVPPWAFGSSKDATMSKRRMW